MSKKIEIKRMTIQMGEKEVELSVEDAKKLLAALKDVFNEPSITTYIPYPAPVVTPRPYPYWWGTYTVGDFSLSSSGETSVLSLATSDTVDMH